MKYHKCTQRKANSDAAHVYIVREIKTQLPLVEKVKNLFKSKEYELLGEETEFICSDCIKKECFRIIKVGLIIFFLGFFTISFAIYIILNKKLNWFSLSLIPTIMFMIVGINLMIRGIQVLLKKNHIKKEFTDIFLVANPPKEIGWEVYGKEAKAISRKEFNKIYKSRLKNF